jgi:2-keto-3-deoxy-6-phosphogluconate aldolase
MTHFIFDHFYKIGVIPVLEIHSALQTKPLAEALRAGGLPIAEGKFDEITRMRKEASDIVHQIRK